LHSCFLLTLRGLFLSVLFGHMTANQTAANRADHRVVPRIMSRHSAYYCAFHATGRVRRADHCRGECHRRKSGFDVTSFHLKSTVLLRGAKVVPFEVFSIDSTAIAVPGFMFLPLPRAGMPAQSNYEQIFLFIALSPCSST
jgi:hypothetical protein